MTDPTDRALIEVTQADRDAAATLLRTRPDCVEDTHPSVVQAFARHRSASAKPDEDVGLMRATASPEQGELIREAEECATYLDGYANIVSQAMYRGERPSGIWQLERASRLLRELSAIRALDLWGGEQENSKPE